MAMWNWSTPCATADGKPCEAARRTGLWAWKHPHRADGAVSYTELSGEVVFDGVDFGYEEGKLVLKIYAFTPNRGRKSLL